MKWNIKLSLELKGASQAIEDIAATKGNTVNHASPSSLPTDSTLFSFPYSSMQPCAPNKGAHSQNCEWEGAC